MAALANGIDNRSSARRAKRNIIPNLLILGVLAFSLVNIFLMAKIIMLEKRRQSTSTSRQPQSGFNLATIIPPRARPPKEKLAKPHPTNIYHATNKSASIGSSWTSPHLVDCHEVVKDMAQQVETGMYVPVRPDGGIFFVMNIHHPMKDDVSYKIFKEGCFECDHLTKLLNALLKYPDSYLLDIGGNIGIWSLVAAAANHQTYTVEPFAENYRRLCKSVDRNSFHDLVHVIGAAATSETAMLSIDLTKSKHNFGGGRVSTVNDVSKIEEKYVVKGVPIDSLNLPTDRPVLMKLDVEGHELQALTGGVEYLQRANIVYAMTELRPTFQSNADVYGSWKNIFGILVSKGLVPYRIDYEVETKLDVNRLHDWRHVKHPLVRYFDVVWRKDQ